MEKKRNNSPYSRPSYKKERGYSPPKKKDPLFVCGIHPVKAALKCSRVIQELLVVREKNTKMVEEFLEEGHRQKIPVREISSREMDLAVSGANHQGVMAILSEKSFYRSLDLLKNGSLVVVLDHLEDPQNFGSILRTAKQMGADGVVIPTHRGVGISPGVLRASSGAAFHIPVIQHSSLIFVLEKLRSWGYWIYGADARGKESLPDIQWSDKVVVVMGNESTGLSENIQKRLDFSVAIPINPSKTVDSLNVSVATGIFLYEIVRSRRLESL